MMANLLSRSNQVQSTECSLHLQVFKQIFQVVHSSCRSIFHSSVPQNSTVRISSARPKYAWDIDALNINWSGLTAYAYLPIARLHRAIHVRQCNCLIIVITPGWPGTPWFWDLVLFSTGIPLHLPVSTTLLILSHNYVFHSNPHIHAWCLGVDGSRGRAPWWR